MKANKVGLINRKKGALSRLQQNLIDFKSKNQDKTTRSGKIISRENEILRIEQEIKNITNSISKYI